jgi:UDP-N-acetyl-2-amino-2-deoxyglucuronate dehydrogenase
MVDSNVHIRNHDRAAGFLQLKNARVRWFLSINENTIPENISAKSQRTYRSIIMEKQELEFSDGFSDLHTKSYQAILLNAGFPLLDALPSINLVHKIRSQSPVGLKGDYHPFAKLPLSTHPFL